MAGKELVLFESQDKSISLNVPLRNDSVWLNRNQMAEMLRRLAATSVTHSVKKLTQRQLSQNLRQFSRRETVE